MQLIIFSSRQKLLHALMTSNFVNLLLFNIEAVECVDYKGVPTLFLLLHLESFSPPFLSLCLPPFFHSVLPSLPSLPRLPNSSSLHWNILAFFVTKKKKKCLCIFVNYIPIFFFFDEDYFFYFLFYFIFFFKSDFYNFIKRIARVRNPQSKVLVEGKRKAISASIFRVRRKKKKEGFLF